jgi:hypothetical protein
MVLNLAHTLLYAGTQVAHRFRKCLSQSVKPRRRISMNWSMSSLRQAAVAAVAVSSVAFGSHAAAAELTHLSPEYMGYYVPGEPASEAQEAGYVNIMKGLAPGADATVDSRDYFRSDNTLCFNTCPTATDEGALKDDGNPLTGANSVDLGDGWAYLIGKYDGPNGGSMVWYVFDLDGIVDIPLTGPEGMQFGLSHYTLFNPNGNGGGPGNGNGGGVPEPASLALVGLGLLGAAAVRRRKQA